MIRNAEIGVTMFSDSWNIIIPQDCLNMLKHTSVSSEDYSSGNNIIIGGNTLGRGVTFPKLQTIYYTRTAKKPQADTMWQHSRMFGYDRDPGLMKVYIDEHLYKLFADINATNNSIIAQITQNLEKIKIYYPDKLNPTRKNVLDRKKISILSGGTNYYPFNPQNFSIEKIDNLLKDFDEKHPSYMVNLRLIKELLQQINLSAIKTEASNLRQYEISALTEDKSEINELAEFFDALASPRCSLPISLIKDIEIIRELNRALVDQEFVEKILITARALLMLLCIP